MLVFVLVLAGAVGYTATHADKVKSVAKKVGCKVTFQHCKK